jgi:hypothetical protein
VSFWVSDTRPAAGPAQLAAVADLAAGLGVEDGAVEDGDAGLPAARRSWRPAGRPFGGQPQHLGVVELEALVARELGGLAGAAEHLPQRSHPSSAARRWRCASAPLLGSSATSKPPSSTAKRSSSAISRITSSGSPKVS